MLPQIMQTCVVKSGDKQEHCFLKKRRKLVRKYGGGEQTRRLIEGLLIKLIQRASRRSALHLSE